MRKYKYVIKDKPVKLKNKQYAITKVYSMNKKNSI